MYVYSVLGLLPISKDLAANYTFCGDDIVKMCENNATTAITFGRRELFQTWNIIKLSAEIYKKNSGFMDPPWAAHPFGKKLLQSL